MAVCRPPSRAGLTKAEQIEMFVSQMKVRGLLESGKIGCIIRIV